MVRIMRRKGQNSYIIGYITSINYHSIQLVMKYKTDLPAHREESAEFTTDPRPVTSRLLKKFTSGILDIREAYLVKRRSFPDSDVSRFTNDVNGS